ncbi:MAG: hypothetical protein HYZ65_05795 [Burkholderiales bacterium]|nr:hypothetical protein [Burkholderiales bacterium]
MYRSIFKPALFERRTVIVSGGYPMGEVQNRAFDGFHLGATPGVLQAQEEN